MWIWSSNCSDIVVGVWSFYQSNLSNRRLIILSIYFLFLFLFFSPFFLSGHHLDDIIPRSDRLNYLFWRMAIIFGIQFNQMSIQTKLASGRLFVPVKLIADWERNQNPGRKKIKQQRTQQILWFVAVHAHASLLPQLQNIANKLRTIRNSQVYICVH